MRGLTTVATNILSEFAVEELELGGIGHFVGATEVDSTNSTAAAEVAHIVGREASWQLRRDDDPDAEKAAATRPAPHLVARSPFAPALTYEDMAERSRSGCVVRRTTLTERVGYDDFGRLNPDAVVMFTYRRGRLRVAREDAVRPAPGFVVIALMRERDVEERSERNAAKEASKRDRRAGSAGPAEQDAATSDTPQHQQRTVERVLELVGGTWTSDSARRRGTSSSATPRGTRCASSRRGTPTSRGADPRRAGL